jgi:hypothetical protein
VQYVSMTIPQISCFISTKSEVGDERDRATGAASVGERPDAPDRTV